jgi:hypothetical protein
LLFCSISIISDQTTAKGIISTTFIQQRVAKQIPLKGLEEEAPQDNARLYKTEVAHERERPDEVTCLEDMHQVTAPLHCRRITGKHQCIEMHDDGPPQRLAQSAKECVHGNRAHETQVRYQ